MVIAKVLGIGVAVITSMCGGFSLFAHSLALCATPNLCCSSTIARPRCANCTVSSITACVPISIFTSPFANPSKTSFRLFPLTIPVRSSTRMSIPARNSFIVLKCCSASISVGAIMQVWKSLSMAISIESSATNVLPDPTSPCNSLFICLPPAMSARISCITLFWAPVSSNFRLFL